MRTIGRVLVGAAALTLVACGGGMKVNTAKMNATKTVAVVGFCQTEDVAAFDGNSPLGRISVGDLLLVGMAQGFDEALPGAWQGVTVKTFASNAENPAIAKRGVWKRRLCMNGIDPMMPKGYEGDPDKPYMADLANKLGVDAVVAVTMNPGLRKKGDAMQMFAGSFNPAHVFVVDRSGETIAAVSVKGLDSDEVPGNSSDAEATKRLGGVFGKALAQKFVAKLRGE